jgi:hypothetical protein
MVSNSLVTSAARGEPGEAKSSLSASTSAMACGRTVNEVGDVVWQFEVKLGDAPSDAFAAQLSRLVSWHSPSALTRTVSRANLRFKFRGSRCADELSVRSGAVIAREGRNKC